MYTYQNIWGYIYKYFFYKHKKNCVIIILCVLIESSLRIPIYFEQVCIKNAGDLTI